MRYILKEKQNTALIIVVIFLLSLLPFVQSIYSKGDIIAGLTPEHSGVEKPYNQIALSARLIKQGVLPLWNNMIGMGHPLLANAEAGVFYPLDLPLFFFLPTDIAYNVSLFLHFFLIGLFTYCYCRTIEMRRHSSFFASAVFMFSAFVISHLDALSRARAMVFMPLFLFIIEKYIRKKNIVYILLLGIAFGIQLLSGYYSLAIYSIIGCLLYAVIRFTSTAAYRKKIFLFAGCILLAIMIGLGISAVQNMPTAELFAYSTRSSGTDRQLLTENSLSPLSFYTMVFPYIFDDTDVDFDVQTRMYIGILPLLCLCFALFWVRGRMKTIILFIAGLSLIIALGQYNPFYPLITKVMPVIKYLGRSYRFMFMTVFFMAVLAGMGLEWLFSNKKINRLKKARQVTVSFLFFFSIAIILYILSGRPINTGVFNAQSREAIAAALATALLTGVYALSAKSLINRRLAVFIIIAAAVLNLIFFNYQYLGIFAKVVPDRRSAGFEPPVAPFLIKHIGDKRIITVEGKIKYGVDALFVNTNIRFYIPSASGGIVIPIKWYEQMYPYLDPEKNLDFLRLGSVKYIVSDTPLSNPELTLAYKKGDVYVYEIARPLAKIRFVSAIRPVGSFNEAIEMIAEGRLDLEKEALVEKAEGLDFFPENKRSPDSQPKHSIIFEGPNRLTVKTDIAKASFMVISEIYYPGWKVFIDGKRDEIYRVNGGFKGVYLQKGNHIVDFIYDPTSFKTGMIITAGSVFALLFAFLIIIRRKTGGSIYVSRK